MVQLSELAKNQLQSAQAEAKGDLEKRQQAVEQLVAPASRTNWAEWTPSSPTSTRSDVSRAGGLKRGCGR